MHSAIGSLPVSSVCKRMQSTSCSSDAESRRRWARSTFRKFPHREGDEARETRRHAAVPIVEQRNRPLAEPPVGKEPHQPSGLDIGPEQHQRLLDQTQSGVGRDPTVPDTSSGRPLRSGRSPGCSRRMRPSSPVRRSRWTAASRSVASGCRRQREARRSGGTAPYRLGDGSSP